MVFIKTEKKSISNVDELVNQGKDILEPCLYKRR